MKRDYKVILLISLVIPTIGIYLGIYAVIFYYTDWPTPFGSQRPERKFLHVGIVSIILAIINLAILWLIFSLM
jgi:hypothetical protein